MNSAVTNARLLAACGYQCPYRALNRAVVKLSHDYPQVFLTLHPGWMRTDMGGPGADIDAATGASGLIALIEAAGPADSGSFRAWDGTRVGW